MTPATKDQLHGLFAHLEEALDARGYFRPAPKKPKMVDNLRAVLTRAGFAEAEIRVLRGVISSLDRFSPAMPRGRVSRRRPSRCRAARRAQPAARTRAARADPARTNAGISGRRHELKSDPRVRSGIGGLTVLREARVLMPERRFIYVADDAGFPYGGGRSRR